MIAMPVERAENYYTIGRLRMLLKLYPVLGFSKPPQDPELHLRVQRAVGGASWTEASAKAADIERAIRWLNDRDWRAAFVVRATCIVGLTERDARNYLRRSGVEVSHVTVHRWKVDGLELMSAYLCGNLVQADLTSM